MRRPFDSAPRDQPRRRWIPTYAENLETARDNIAAIIAEITADPKPTYSLEGQSVSWESYLSMLLDKQEVLNKAIQQAGSPFQVTHRGRF